MPSVSSMPSASPSVEPTASPTSTLLALQRRKEAIRKGSYDAGTDPNYIVLGVVGFAICVVLSIFSHRTYKTCKSRKSHRTGSDDYDEDE
eukprot:scaffold16810_cov102-Skeletonema_marinoi.AAC.1